MLIKPQHLRTLHTTHKICFCYSHNTSLSNTGNLLIFYSKISFCNIIKSSSNISKILIQIQSLYCYFVSTHVVYIIRLYLIYCLSIQ